MKKLIITCLCALCAGLTLKAAPQGVDLGLNVIWASANMDGFYAWGETQPSERSDMAFYKYCNGTSCSYTKYCPKREMGYLDYKDKLNRLEAKDDPATAAYGPAWRVPTVDDWNELINGCTWTWTKDYQGTGVAGYVVTGRKAGYTENSIFLPADGCKKGKHVRHAGKQGFYWAANLDPENANNAMHLFLYKPKYYFNSYRICSFDRVYGLSVRPVSKK